MHDGTNGPQALARRTTSATSLIDRGDDPALHAEEFPMPWIYLALAGLFEIGWAVGLKYSDGFTRLWPSVGTATAMIISVLLLALAIRSLPIGTAYAIWTGIGAVGAVILGIALFGDSAAPLRLLCVALIVAGIVGLKLTAH
jgi:quaternary ammonium compound-resistance protein SugE